MSLRAFAAASLALVLAGCGSSNITTPPARNLPTPEPVRTEVTIRASGIDPTVFHIFDTRKVKFVNADNTPHSIFSDQHPAHDTCRGVLNVTLQAGESLEIENLPIDACFFHDESNPAAVAFQGVLVVH